MQVIHPLFGELEYDDYEGYKTKKIVSFSGKETEIELIIKTDNEIEKDYCETYETLMINWDEIVPNVIQAIIQYQNEEWSSTDHTQSFPQFKTPCDVLENIKLFGIKIATLIMGHKKQKGCYVVLTFEAEWVNDDYGILSVALDDGKVIEVSDQDI
jgi:hypothetical protein